MVLAAKMVEVAVWVVVARADFTCRNSEQNAEEVGISFREETASPTLWQASGEAGEG